MPQTVSLVRGSTFINTNSVNTLYTMPSTGIASRVIVNYYSAIFSTNITYSSGGLQVTRDGINNGIGFWRFSNSSAKRGVYMMPSESIQYAQPGTNGGGYTRNALLSTTNTTGDEVSMETADIISTWNFIPKNFWIGPSDVIKASTYNSENSYTLYYSFTIITES